MVGGTLEDIECVLRDFHRSSGRLVRKDDFKNLPIPSYNTCSRRGLNLFKLNAEFRRNAYENSLKNCKSCSLPLPFEKRMNDFCSHSCSATYQGATSKEQTTTKDGVYKTYVPLCDMCMVELETGRTQKSFCSQQCSADKKYYDGLFLWLFIGKTTTNRAIRRYLEDLQGYQCSVCGISSWNEKKLVLEVEHISGDSEDNTLKNVCLICPNCHSQTSTYKGRNKGNGRHSRRERYRTGKSY